MTDSERVVSTAVPTGDVEVATSEGTLIETKKDLANSVVSSNPTGTEDVGFLNIKNQADVSAGSGTEKLEFGFYEFGSYIATGNPTR